MNAQGHAHETIDGADPANAARRKELFGISGRPGEYPQFFVLNNDTGSTKFYGGWDKFQVAMQDGSLSKTFSRAKKKNGNVKKSKPPPPPLPEQPAAKDTPEVKSGCACVIS